MNKVYDLLYKRGEHNGKAQWAKCGVMIEKEDGKKSVKLDLVPAGNWDGWLVVSERKEREMETEAF
jgi:hypothetical protein